jgi:phosphoglycerate dehydrogenase-like enzyme
VATTPSIGVVLSPQFPESGVPQVRHVSPDVQALHLASLDRLPAQVGDARVLAWWDSPRAELARLRAAMPYLRWVQSHIAGIGDQRLHEVLGPDVLLTSAAGVYADLVAEHALTLMLALYRRLPELLEQQRRGEWKELATRSLTGDTLGVIGAGGIGRATARLARAFGMRTLGINRGGSAVPELDQTLRPDELPLLLREADVVLIAAPSTPATRGMIDEQALHSMRRSAVLINVARGPLVVTDDLVRALEQGWIAGAGLDVTDPEPLPPEHPLWSAPGAIVTPHHGNPPALSTAPAVARFCENLRRYLAGEPLIAVVDPQQGY